jgi:hypothetical protein
MPVLSLFEGRRLETCLLVFGLRLSTKCLESVGFDEPQQSHFGGSPETSVVGFVEVCSCVILYLYSQGVVVQGGGRVWRCCFNMFDTDVSLGV